MREVFLHVLNGYLDASNTSIANHPMAEFIRTKFNQIFEPLLPSENRYLVKGSPGQGNWGKVPWIATFDTLITSTAQEGYYITYLFKSDMSGVYLNLNQGVTDIQERYKAKARDVLLIRAKDFRAQLGSLADHLQAGKIDLGDDLPTSVALYNYGSICSKLYSRDQFPEDEILLNDYREFLKLYEYLVDNDNTSVIADLHERNATPEEFYEDTRKKRKHERIDRNPKLAKAAKAYHGYKCQACGFDFKKTYGNIGSNFIEAHHLVPLSSIIQEEISLDPKKDFAVLCSNCHRMIHKMENVQNIDELKKMILSRK